MKVQFKNLLKAYSGSCDGLVYFYNSRLDTIVCRKYVKPKESSSNKRLSMISRNLKALEPSEGYKQDLAIYAAMHRRHEGDCIILGWSNAFTKLMHAMGKSLQVDIATLTREDIYHNVLPCISVKSAVEAGLLPVVAGYERLDSEL
jgi:hypothetical protein